VNDAPTRVASSMLDRYPHLRQTEKTNRTRKKRTSKKNRLSRGGKKSIVVSLTNTDRDGLPLLHK